jgi:PAS domain S-box-containing protein
MTDRGTGPGNSVLEQLFRVTQEGFWHIDADAITLDVNPAMCEILGRPRDDIVGRSIFDMVDGDNARIFHKEMAARADGQSGRYEITLTKPDGSSVPCANTATILTNENGIRTGSVGLWTDLSEVKRTDEALRESETRFRDFAETASDWFWETDADLRHVSFAGDPEKTLVHIAPGSVRRTREQVLSDVLTDREKANGAKWQAHFADLAARRPFRNLLYERMLSNGETAWTRSSGQPIFDSEDRFCGYRGSASDATEEVLLGAELAQFRDTLDRTKDCLFTFDPVSLRFTYINRGAIDMVGYSKAELLNMTPVDIKPEFDEASFRELIEPLIEGKKPALQFEAIHQAKDGHQIPVEIVLQYMDDVSEGAPRCIAVVRDLTTSKEAREAVFRQETQHRLIVDNLPVLISYLDMEQHILFCNATTEKWYGRPASEILGKTTGELFDSGLIEKTGPKVSRVLKGEVVNFQEFVRYPDGKSRYVDITYVPHKGDSRSDDVTAYFVLATDITEMKKIEADLVVAKEEAEQANRAKSEFLANMSHELRTPLNAINGYAQMVEMEPYGPVGSPRYLEYVSHIRESGDHLLDIIDDILDLTRIEAGKMLVVEETVDLGDITQSCLRFLDFRLAEKSLKITTPANDTWPALNADPRMVRQMLLNILSNAMKFSEPGSHIEITSQQTDETGLTISVQDSGIGMDETELVIAVERFGQIESSLSRSNEGTGLGLPLVQSQIELHGGTLTIQSEKGIGTRVSLVFPPERIVASQLNEAG